MTDEKKKVRKSSKSESGGKQHDCKDTVNAPSSIPQSARSTKSVRSVFRLLSTKSEQSEADTIKDVSAETCLDSRPTKSATKALSVTARWGVNQQSPNKRCLTAGCNDVQTTSRISEYTDTRLSVSDESRDQVNDIKVANNLTVENMSKKCGKKNRKSNRGVKLYESLDASVLRDALVNQKDTQSNKEDSHQTDCGCHHPGLTTAASDQDLSCTDRDVPALDLQSSFGSPRSCLKLVCCGLFSTLASCMCTYTVLHKKNGLTAYLQRSFCQSLQQY